MIIVDLRQIRTSCVQACNFVANPLCDNRGEGKMFSWLYIYNNVIHDMQTAQVPQKQNGCDIHVNNVPSRLCTSCAQVHDLPQNHCSDIYIYIYIYLSIYLSIYLCIYIYIYGLKKKHISYWKHNYFSSFQKLYQKLYQSFWKEEKYLCFY